MKYLRICSDLHLEGFMGRDPETLAIDFIPRDERDADAVLVLAGDISSVPDQLVGFIKTVMPRFHKTIFVPGNHEYYRHNYDAWNTVMQERFETYCPGLKFALGEVGMFAEDGVRFLYTTLWGDGGISVNDAAKVGYFLNDFRLITRDGGHYFTVADMKDIHHKQKDTLTSWLKMPYAGKTVVVTHHMPSRQLVSPRFREKNGSDGANGGFVGDCESILSSEYAPNIWIHGHTHCKIDTMLWDTRVVCNPTGYRGEWSLADVGGQVTFIEL